LSRTHFVVADRWEFFPLAISPDWSVGESARRFLVCFAVFFGIVPSLRLPIRLDVHKLCVLKLRTMVLSETRHAAGLTLPLVQREGLELYECLD
jgi:hypothetical protein